jgi:hypothetical protein
MSTSSFNSSTMKLSKPRPNRPPHHANSRGTAFENPWPKGPESNFSDSNNNWTLPQFLTQGWAKFPLEWATAHTGHPHKPVEVVDPMFGSKKFSENRDKIQATWLGHAVSLHLVLVFAKPAMIVLSSFSSRRWCKLRPYQNIM